jgi:hypothetical protein
MTYSFRLERTDGSPADPPTYRSTVLTWRQGDTIPLGADRTLRVVGVRDEDADQPAGPMPPATQSSQRRSTQRPQPMTRTTTTAVARM